MNLEWFTAEKSRVKNELKHYDASFEAKYKR